MVDEQLLSLAGIFSTSTTLYYLLPPATPHLPTLIIDVSVRMSSHGQGQGKGRDDKGSLPLPTSTTAAPMTQERAEPKISPVRQLFPATNDLNIKYHVSKFLPELLAGRREEKKLQKMKRQAMIDKAQREYLECLEAMTSTELSEADELQDDDFLKGRGLEWKEVELDW